ERDRARTYPTHLAAVPRAGCPRTADGRPGPGMRRPNARVVRSVAAPRRRLRGALLLQLAFEQLDLFGKRGVWAHETFDLSWGVSQGCMIATVETSTALRERTQRQGLGEIHRHLLRAHHIGRAPRRQKVRAADIVLPRHHPLNVFDFDPLRILRTDQVAHLAFGHFERDWLAGQLAVSQKS